MTDTRPLSAIVGRNVRRLRTDSGHSGDDLAKALRRAFETTWTSARVSDLENGRVSPTVPTLFMLSHGLGGLLRRPVRIGELLRSDGFVEIGNVAISAATVAAAFDGEGRALRIADYSDSERRKSAAVQGFTRAVQNLRTLPEAAQDVPLSTLEQVERESGEAEQRAAKSLGLPLLHFVALSATLWGRTYSQERDRRAGPDATAQKRGRVGRDLRSELREAAGHGDD